MTGMLVEAIRQLVEDYADLQAEHTRLGASPYDANSYEAHTVKLYRHMCRVQFVLEELRQRSREAAHLLWGSQENGHPARH
jgi:hypothetical protein